MVNTTKRSRKQDIRSPSPRPLGHDSFNDFILYVKYMYKISGSAVQTPVFSIIVVLYLVAHRDYLDFYTDIYMPIIATLRP